MATRIDIELTSRRDDQTFTWRAAGAREPKGVADISLFPSGSSVGEQFKVEAEIGLDGTTITNVIPPKESKAPRDQTLELLARDDEPLVTQQLAGKPRGRDRGDRKGGRGPRSDRNDRGPKEAGRDGGREGSRERRPRTDERPRTPAKPKLPPKPKPPRLKAGRVHRDALLGSLPEEQKAVAQELVRGGLQAVRQALAKQNEQHKAEGAPAIDEGPILALAEELLTKVRAAEWRDRAEAALEQAEVVDLRDLRSVVTAADGSAKDEETRALGAQLRQALNTRLDAEHNGWVNEIIELLDDDRSVRALHLSSRPPKAGAPLPAPVAMRLVEAANASMTSEISPDRWGYILEALALSPVRRQVVPASLPTTVTPELKTIIARFGTQLPEIAGIFGIEPDPKAGRGERRRKPKVAKKPKPPKPAESNAPPADEPEAASPAAEEPKVEEPKVEEPKTEEPKAEETRGRRARGARRRGRDARRQRELTLPLSLLGGDFDTPASDLTPRTLRSGLPGAGSDAIASDSAPRTVGQPDCVRVVRAWLCRPRYSPVLVSSSHRAPQEAQMHESMRSEARYRRSIS